MAVSVDEAMLEKITSKVKEILEINGDITIDENLANLGLDSLKSVALIVDLEESFNIVFEDEELLFEYYSTIQKIAGRVVGKLE
jgi:acyl carrier protein